MRVAVGSGNPVKVEATERALSGDDGFGESATVGSRPVPSGVPEQPRGRVETRRGAENRAERALAAGDYDLGVGVEGGVAPFEFDPGSDGGNGRDGDEETLALVMWAAVTDGSRMGRAAGPTLALPAGVARRIRGGAELGPVMDDVLGEDDVARRQGAAGALTGGRVDRTDALATAVAGALGPFVSGLYDECGE